MNQAAPSTARIGRIGWYARRATRMSPAELAGRAYDQALHTAWSRLEVQREEMTAMTPVPGGPRRFTAVLPPDTAERVTEEARAAVLAAADLLMKGELEVLGVVPDRPGDTRLVPRSGDRPPVVLGPLRLPASTTDRKSRPAT